MTSTIRKMSLRDKYFMNASPIPAAGPNTWYSIYGDDLATMATLQAGKTPPGHSAPWFANGPSYLLKDAGSTIYQKSENGVTQRIFRKVQWVEPNPVANVKEAKYGYICVFHVSGESGPFVRHG